MNTQAENDVKAASPVASFHGTRLISLDVFRGLTVAAMILVTDPGTYSAVYSQLSHAAWTGATLTDMIFPSFLLITGIALTLSFATRMLQGASRAQLFVHVARRSGLLVLIGLALNGFPDYNLHTIRIPGILQRIAFCYFFGSLLYLLAQTSYAAAGVRQGRRILILGVASLSLLVLYWIVIKVIRVPHLGVGRLDTYGSLSGYVDRSIFGVRHLWPWGTTPGIGVTYDPEGLLSTFPALSTLLFGVIAGEWLREERSPARKAIGLAISGALLFVLGLALSPFVALIKKIWSPSFALLSAGFALSAFALCYFVIDVRGCRRWTAPWRVFGTNAILAFVTSTIITILADRTHIAGPAADGTLRVWCYQHLFANWMSPMNASLAYATLIVVFNLVLLLPLYRRRIVVRI